MHKSDEVDLFDRVQTLHADRDRASHGELLLANVFSQTVQRLPAASHHEVQEVAADTGLLGMWDVLEIPLVPFRHHCAVHLQHMIRLYGLRLQRVEPLHFALPFRHL